MSGATNAGEAFDLIVGRPAAESTYAGIVRLVEEAARARAPMVRLADRFAIVFLVVTLAIAGGGVARLRRPGALAGGDGGGDPLPADPGGAGGDHRRGVAGGAHRRADQGRRRAGGAGRRHAR